MIDRAYGTVTDHVTRYISNALQIFAPEGSSLYKTNGISPSFPSSSPPTDPSSFRSKVPPPFLVHITQHTFDMSACSWNSLPTELKLHTIAFLRPEGVKTLSQVSYETYTLCIPTLFRVRLRVAPPT